MANRKKITAPKEPQTADFPSAPCSVSSLLPAIQKFADLWRIENKTQSLALKRLTIQLNEIMPKKQPMTVEKIDEFRRTTSELGFAMEKLHLLLTSTLCRGHSARQRANVVDFHVQELLTAVMDEVKTEAEWQTYITQNPHFK